MTDPFVQYLEHWAPSVGMDDAFRSWLEKQAGERVAAYVIDDIEPFMANTGVFIEGRRQWRNHLVEKNCDELGHADIKRQGEKWTKKREAFKERIKNAEKLAPQREYRENYDAPLDRPAIAVEVMNRLHGKATPPRKEIIKLTLDVAKRMKHARR